MTGADLAALVAARLCHDLISPIGAIGNGLELMALDAWRPGPELALVSEAVAQAAGRVRFLRLAFGSCAEGQRIGAAEVRQTLSEAMRSGRVTVAWGVEGDCARVEARLALLAVMCLEAAMPRGGQIAVVAGEGRWTVTARASRFRPEAGPFAALGTDAGPAGCTPSTVQFALLHAGAQALGRALAAEVGEAEARIVF